MIFLNIIEWIEEKRCYNCPAHSGGFNGEDYDDDCIINPDYGYKLCRCAFLPKFVIRRLIQKCYEEEAKSWDEYMKKEYGPDWETRENSDLR